MKKRIMATAMALVLSIVTLAGCGGSSKDDYLNDIAEIAEFSQDSSNVSDDPEDMVAEMTSLLKDMKVKTAEGKAIKDDFQEMIDALNTMLQNQDDADAVMKALGNLTSVYETLEDDAEKLLEAAEKAGVDDNDLKALDFDFGF